MSSGLTMGGAMEEEPEMTRLCLGIGGSHGNERRLTMDNGGASGAAVRHGKHGRANCARRTKNHWLKGEQVALLEASFRRHNIPPQDVKQDLAQQLRLPPRQVEVWFQNRRAWSKLKQTELERDMLRQYYDSLIVQNARLQQEITEVRYCLAWPTVPPSTAAAAMAREAAAAAGPSSSIAAKIIIELD